MRREFTIYRYKELLEALIERNFSFARISANLDELNKYMGSLKSKNILLRQDVDRLPGNSLEVARIQEEMGIRSTFYFRSVQGSFELEVIEKIAALGQEIGYHYEDLSLVANRLKTPTFVKTSVGRHDVRHKEEKIVKYGIESFERNLEKFRKSVPVKSICMHGSPLSRWDSRLLWKYYDYKDFGIENEPYFDVSFEDRLYLTDTGRRWNGGYVSVRDKVNDKRRTTNGAIESDHFNDWKRKPIPGSLMNMTSKAMEFQSKYNFRHTKDIIKSIGAGEFPEKVMMTFHPQRWTDKLLPWLKELMWQNVKNVGKYFIIKLRN